MNFRFVFLSTMCRLFFSQWDLPKLITWSLVNKKKSKSQFKKFSELFFILRGYLFQRFRHFKVDTMFGPLLPQTTQAQVNSARGYVHFYKRKVYYFGWRSVKIDFFSIVGSVLEIWFCKVIVEIFAMCK